MAAGCTILHVRDVDGVIVEICVPRGAARSLLPPATAKQIRPEA
jgi:hypothetical protein